MVSHYAMTKHSDGWAIIAEGTMLLVCARRKTALRAIRDAIAQEESAVPADEATIVPAQHAHPHHDDGAVSETLDNVAKQKAFNSSS